MSASERINDSQDNQCSIRRTIAAFKQVKNLNVALHHSRTSPSPLPRISQERINKSSLPATIGTQDDPSPPNTVLYLAYGSNLAASTFLDMRGIRPLAALNVVVPSLALTFDLPGVPYNEPCFANTRRRDPNLPPSPPPPTTSEKPSPFPHQPPKYHKDTWSKGLVGVVYEVTPSDSPHIIATEGGGASYNDIFVPCHILPPDSETVPLRPSTPSFMAHTLFAPASGPNSHDRTTRPDPSYAQPSPRYLSLITTGAAEHSLPDEYRTWLATLGAYRTTSEKQRLGGWIFLSMWAPVIAVVFWLMRTFADEKGRSPAWVVEVLRTVFGGMWASYDGVFKDMFGEGERTVE